ncbi:hypothetical protein HALLA_02655 (plasmid) [Halostagnicola larsenii XH-48]|uniref:Phenylacetic acid degradation PaaB family protein n=1 Tax=Halostagnicola larsenii XH-48 TaxID=797299 RepID=W0JRU1_9EURY|nr:phenylacetic acid degradation PaaB family protein [Halostagnicola larsenii]AHG01299.1 hypothetical protein HALLA_02655 [Halostagnicola larsenii XH-48]
MKYEVFARINQGDDTIHVGTVTAQSDRLARMYAYNTFDEEDWNYLAVVREENLLEVSGDQPKREVAAGE